ncbi:hypothetical protein D7W82_20200 [Corallococcus sp. CA049B]|nr:hypothetical protein D7W82_20200 [Corallococcus sp. CA049B]
MKTRPRCGPGGSLFAPGEISLEERSEYRLALSTHGPRPAPGPSQHGSEAPVPRGWTRERRPRQALPCVEPDS